MDTPNHPIRDQFDGPAEAGGATIVYGAGASRSFAGFSEEAPAAAKRPEGPHVVDASWVPEVYVPALVPGEAPQVRYVRLDPNAQPVKVDERAPLVPASPLREVPATSYLPSDLLPPPLPGIVLRGREESDSDATKALRDWAEKQGKKPRGHLAPLVFSLDANNPDDPEGRIARSAAAADRNRELLEQSQAASYVLDPPVATPVAEPAPAVTEPEVAPGPPVRQSGPVNLLEALAANQQLLAYLNVSGEVAEPIVVPEPTGRPALPLEAEAVLPDNSPAMQPRPAPPAPDTRVAEPSEGRAPAPGVSL